MPATSLLPAERANPSLAVPTVYPGWTLHQFHAAGAPDTDWQRHVCIEDLQHGNGKQHVAVIANMVALAHCCHWQHRCATCTRRVLLKREMAAPLGAAAPAVPGTVPRGGPEGACRTPTRSRSGGRGRPPATRMAGGASWGQLVRITAPADVAIDSISHCYRITAMATCSAGHLPATSMQSAHAV